MTRISNAPEDFSEEMLDGFVALNGRHVRRVDGGVVRSTKTPVGQVAVVIGGGSGHYPAFAGLVGPGLAAGSACGNIFASPSAGQIHRVAKASERGGGVLFSYGNYAGDVLHFGQAEERLRADGIDVRAVRVTDDIASASVDEIEKRRGIAGDLSVFKIAGAAAEAGYDLDAVEAVARRANYRTRSLGVAFAGCTLPGATEPLFTVPEGLMSVGLGIHGEPGISEEPIPTAHELAVRLVEALLADKPHDAGTRVVVLLNGLGTVKYEELFVLYNSVRHLLTDAGLEIADAESGELVTSLDMAGLSLTLLWLDDELENLWNAPADTPAFRKGSVLAEADDAPVAEDAIAARASDPLFAAHRDSVPAAVDLLVAVRDLLLAQEGELGRIDAIAGDGDHGIGMARGAVAAAKAAEKALPSGAGIGALLAEAGDAWSERGGGTSGALWGVAIEAAGAALAESATLDAASAVRAVRNALDAMRTLGKAEVGDKTMIDSFVPFADTLALEVESGRDLAAAWRIAAEASSAAAAATAELRPRLGRARPLAEKSIGHPDAGAISFAMIVTTIGDRLPKKV